MMMQLVAPAPPAGAATQDPAHGAVASTSFAAWPGPRHGVKGMNMAPGKPQRMQGSHMPWPAGGTAGGVVMPVVPLWAP